jgi:hypothetical protein
MIKYPLEENPASSGSDDQKSSGGESSEESVFSVDDN